MGRYDASIDTILNIEWQDIKALMDTLDRSVMEQIIELPLTAEEQAQFHACCDGIRTNMEHLKEL